MQGYSSPRLLPRPLGIEQSRLRSTAERQRVKNSCVKLVAEVQRLFAYMALSHKKYVNPVAILHALLDERGLPFAIGDQKDVGEFNINFLERIQEGLMLAQLSSGPSSSPEAFEAANAIQVAEFRPSTAQRLGGSQYLGLSPQMHKKSFISDTFFGMLVVLIEAQEADGTKVERMSDTTFGQVIIEGANTDLYEGWEASYFTEIENYITPKVFASRYGRAPK
jgi:ubiquitin carboxyl-terminal hydrolase 25/28